MGVSAERVGGVNDALIEGLQHLEMYEVVERHLSIEDAPQFAQTLVHLDYLGSQVAKLRRGVEVTVVLGIEETVLQLLLQVCVIEESRTLVLVQVVEVSLERGTVGNGGEVQNGRDEDGHYHHEQQQLCH